MKKILILLGVGAAFLAGGAIFTRRKLQDLQEIINNIKLTPLNPDNVQVQGSNLTLTMDLEILNQTNKAFTIETGGIVTLSRLFLFSNTGVKLAEALVNEDKISLAPFGIHIADQIFVQIPINLALETTCSMIKKYFFTLLRKY